MNPSPNQPRCLQWLQLIQQRLQQQQPLTPVEQQQLMLTVQRMKDDGSWKMDPDFTKLIEALHFYTQKSRMVQGTTQAVTSSSSGVVRPAPVSGGLPASQQPPATPAVQRSPFTKEQLQRLHYQILAFKCLSRNQPIPVELQQAIQLTKKQHPMPHLPPGQQLPYKIAEVTLAHHQLQQQQQQTAVKKGEEGSAGGGASSSPHYANLRPQPQLSTHRTLIPDGKVPIGLDPLAMAEERNRRIQCRVLNRIAELEQLPADLPMEPACLEMDHLTPKKEPGTEDTKGSDTRAIYLDENGKPLTKVKALIELKALRLLEKQKRLRAEIVAAMKHATTLQTAVSRTDYRRLKKPSVREIRMTEKMERQQRLERERKEKMKQLEQVNGILQHGRDMLAWRKGLAQKQTKLGRAVLHWHATVEKEEQKRLERVTKERIKALKADDEEAYLKLIDKQKDTRITHLLQQTDSYLSSLTSLVQSQKEDIASKAEPGAVMMEAPEPSDFIDDEQSVVDYYNTCHRVREKVVEQPVIMVNGQLKDYQLKGLEWMVSLYNNKLNGILADEMGLGKTIQTISLVTFLMEKKNQNGPFLILVPLSTITNWSLEFEKWAPSVVKVVYKGTPNQRRHIQLTEMRAGTFNVLLTTYEYIIKDKSVLSKYRWVYTIIDEGHRMKNASSKLAVTLSQYYHSRYRLILTGTPLQNNLPELWALLNFVLPKVFNSVKSFDEWFNTPFANTGERIELNEEEQLLIIKRLHKVLRPFLLRRLKKDVEADLPDKTERILKTPLSGLQQKLYSQIRQSGAMMIGNAEGKKVGIRSINNTVMQLRKVCNHPYVFNEVEDSINPDHITDENIMRVSGKFELLDRLLSKLKATGHRVLIFFQMTAVMDIMEDFLRWKDMKYLRLDGSTKAEDRSALLKLYNAPDSEYFVFILSTRAGGLGLNLQSADTVIIFDSDWNPHQDLQAQDRAHRIGQTKEVRIFRLITANSVEETILARAQYKLDLDGKVIQAGKFDNKSTNEERDQFLRGLFENNPDENDVNDVEDDDELNEIIARSEEEMEVFRKIDAERIKTDEEWWKGTGRKGPVSRLITFDELPAHYLHESVPEEEKDNPLDFGRGQRVKDNVRYDDGLSEEQWTRAIDNEVDINSLVEKREKLREKRQQKKLQREDSMGVGESDDESVTSYKRQRSVSKQPSEEPDSPRAESSAARKKQKTHVQSTIVESDVEEEAPSTNPAHADPLGPEQRQRLTSLMTTAYEHVETCTVKEDDADEARQCCELFYELPSKELYPDYYQIISKPISMDIIKARIDSNHYSSIEQFRDDFHLMFKNAQTYNVEGSMVYEDAALMKAAFDSALNESSTNGNA